MKALFLVFHGFADHNGISKKIYSQVAAMRADGVPTVLCYTAFDEHGNQLRMVDDTILTNYGHSQMAKITKRVCLGALGDYILDQGITMVYMRSNHNANPFLIGLMRQLRRAGVRVVMEIPTYPYDQEYTGTPLGFRSRLWVDRIFRRQLARQLYRIVTFSGYGEIFSRPTINISNGIDFDSIPTKRRVSDDQATLNLIGVAEIHSWHAFDRVIAGLAHYYAQGEPPVRVVFDVVGTGFQGIDQELKKQVGQAGLEKYVVFHGRQAGEALDSLFEQADMGVASLGRHRSGITNIKTLKNREYAARGIPFIYSETDDDFERMPYIMKAPADESPIDIHSLVEFYRTAPRDPATIRASIEGTLSWKAQMQKVIDVVNEK